MNLTHAHLLLSHLPVLGTMFGVLLLCAALVRRSTDLRRAAYATFVACALLAAPTYLTGEPAEDVVENVPGIADRLIERHEESAGVALALVLTLGAIGLAGWAVDRRAPGLARVCAYAALVVGFATTGALAVTANRGGAIRHSEIRDGTTAAHDDRGYDDEHR